jgi:hypothetical protein
MRPGVVDEIREDIEVRSKARVSYDPIASPQP